MTHPLWYDTFRTKKSYKRRVCFIMYIRKSFLGGLTAAAGMAALAVGMGRMPLCNAARGFPDISVKTLSEQRQLLGTCGDEKSVSFCCHPQAE